jgi:recombination protein RecR
VTPAFEQLLQVLKHLPGLGYRSAERVALHLLVEQPEAGLDLKSALEAASAAVQRCLQCGNLSEEEKCKICMESGRVKTRLCVVEHVPDLFALERSGAWSGCYHVLHGKLSPIHGVGPEQLNLASLGARLDGGEVRELVLALSNDIEGQATCHYIQEEMVGSRDIEVTRIGFGLPSGGGVTFADSVTLKSALEGRRTYE